MVVTANSHPYLSRGYAPQRNEYSLDDLDIEGPWPTDLQGSFYRIGPNPRFAPMAPYNPLLADGMVHAFHINNGRVRYLNRWVRTRRFLLEDAAGHTLFATSGNPAHNHPSVRGEPGDGVANTNVVWHGGRLLALEEGHAPFELSPHDLGTMGHFDFAGALPRNMTAHPKIDPVTGELLSFANFEDRRYSGAVGVHVTDARGVMHHTFTVNGPFPALMHDFAITHDHILLLYGSVTVSLERMRSGRPPLAFESGRESVIGVLRRDQPAATPRWFSGPPCMAWHVVNAFDEGDAIVLDLCQQDSPMFPRDDGTLPDPMAAAQHLTRWRLDLAQPRSVDVTRLYDRECEYPRIDERRTGQPHAHAWFACLGGPGTADIFQRGIACFDYRENAMAIHDAGASSAVAEPVFVPRAPDSPEGDGYVLTNIYDEGRDASHLAVFDALNVSAGPIARAHLPHRMPVGFHGCWRPGA